MSLVYLAGGIAGLPGTQTVDWRKEAADKLYTNHGIFSLSPMRGKEVLSRSSAPIATNFMQYEAYGPFFTARGIMTRDYNDVCRADALLVNLLGLVKPSLGTIMELAWAWQLRTPAVVVMEPTGNPHDGHPMIHEAIPFRVASLDEAIETVAIILGG